MTPLVLVVSLETGNVLQWSRHTQTSMKQIQMTVSVFVFLLLFLCFRKCLKLRSSARLSSEEERRAYRYWRVIFTASLRRVRGQRRNVEEQIAAFGPLCWLLNRLYCNKVSFWGGGAGAHMEQIVGCILHVRLFSHWSHFALGLISTLMCSNLTHHLSFGKAGTELLSDCFSIRAAWNWKIYFFCSALQIWRPTMATRF